MSVINKVGIVSFQPPKWVVFNLFHKFYHGSLNILEYYVVSFIPNYPHTQEPKKLYKRTSLSRHSNKLVNWKKWSWRLSGLTPEMPIQFLMCCHIEPKISQRRNRWVADLSNPHPATGWRMPCLKRLILVGSLSRSNLQERIETFNRTCLCQTSSPVTSIKGAAW